LENHDTEQIVADFKPYIREYYEPLDNFFIRHIKRHVILTIFGITFIVSFIISYIAFLFDSIAYEIFGRIFIYSFLLMIYPISVDFFLRVYNLEKKMTEVDKNIPYLESHLNPLLFDIQAKKSYKRYESGVFKVGDISIIILLILIGIYIALFLAIPILAFVITIYPFIRLVLLKTYYKKQIEFINRAIIIITNPQNGSPSMPLKQPIIRTPTPPIPAPSSTGGPLIRYCPECGKKLERTNTRFCTNCGYNIY